MNRVLAGWAAFVPLVAALGLLAPPPLHSHTGLEPVPSAESEPCTGGGVHLHRSDTHGPAPCSACAAGPAPTAAPAFSLSQPQLKANTPIPRHSPSWLCPPPAQASRTRAPPAGLL